MNLTSRAPARTGDTPAMVEARAAFLRAGHFAPLADRIAAGARGARLVVEVGAGTGYYLSRLLDRVPGASALAVDVSKAAAARAARAHERVASIIADVEASLPVGNGVADLALSIFAPRPVQEVHRILVPDGAFLVAMPTPRHLAELRPVLGLIHIDPAKEERLRARMAAFFELKERGVVEYPLVLSRADCVLAAAMGPNAFHVNAGELQRRAEVLPDVVNVTASFTLWWFRRSTRPQPSRTDPGPC